MERNSLRVLSFDAVVIGSGCAGFNCADHLFMNGVKNIAIVTEDRLAGTSRNTGSDKQTYYKLSLAGDEGDSVLRMAETLFSGGGVDGDVALAEAAGSARGFLRLAELGVPFPTNRYGEYVGYRTDHDTLSRASSIGPYTSRKMTEVLEASVAKKNIPVLDRLRVISLIVARGKRLTGLLALDLSAKRQPAYVAIRTPYAVLATGGPAGIYADTVYPGSQFGASDLALAAGASFSNLSEWQYGLASVDFRWNVSGTYQQVLPRYISVDNDGNEREFLCEAFDDQTELLRNVFLKGYEWPFDVRKLRGSSYIDLLVYRETVLRGRQVYLDYTRNPSGLDGGFDVLDATTREYLENSGALFGTPIERLFKMNPGAVSLYREHGIDLTREPLRIAVCTQHNNGGIAVDADWQTDVKGLYAAGEAAGTFGLFRPGGSALNSTQVGSMRAAEHIAFSADNTTSDDFDALLSGALADADRLIAATRADDGKSTLAECRARRQALMSRSFAFLRKRNETEAGLAFLLTEWASFEASDRWKNDVEIPELFRNRGNLLTEIAVASAMTESLRRFGTRGSAYCFDGDALDRSPLPASPDGGNYVLTTVMQNGAPVSGVRPVRPIPARDSWFENVWREYREKRKRKNESK